jgi:hypothetical protein
MFNGSTGSSGSENHKQGIMRSIIYSQSRTVVATKRITLFFSGLLQFRQGKVVALGRLPILWIGGASAPKGPDD